MRNVRNERYAYVGRHNLLRRNHGNCPNIYGNYALNISTPKYLAFKT